MGSTENISIGDARIQSLLESFLRLRSTVENREGSNLHLDEDTLAAFTEGNMTMREATPIVSHLSDCTFCRHKTSELIRLDLAFAEDQPSLARAENREPAKVSEVLSGILSRLFGTGESAVFAHEEKPQQEEPDQNEKDVNDK